MLVSSRKSHPHLVQHRPQGAILGLGQVASVFSASTPSRSMVVRAPRISTLGRCPPALQRPSGSSRKHKTAAPGARSRSPVAALPPGSAPSPALPAAVPKPRRPSSVPGSPRRSAPEAVPAEPPRPPRQRELPAGPLPAAVRSPPAVGHRPAPAACSPPPVEAFRMLLFFFRLHLAAIDNSKLRRFTHGFQMSDPTRFKLSTGSRLGGRAKIRAVPVAVPAV